MEQLAFTSNGYSVVLNTRGIASAQLSPQTLRYDSSPHNPHIFYAQLITSLYPASADLAIS